MGLPDLLGLWVFTVVAGFVFCRWGVVERAVQAALVPPPDPRQGGQLDLAGSSPRAAGADQLGLVQAVDRLGQRVVDRVARGADRGHRALVGRALGGADTAAVDRDDYLRAGAEALVRAARTWRPDAGSPFVPYAWAAVGRAMRAEQSRMRWRRQADRRPDRTPTWWRYGWPSSRRSPHLQAVVRLCWIEDWSRRRQGVGSGSPSRQWRCVRGPLVGAG